MGFHTFSREEAQELLGLERQKTSDLQKGMELWRQEATRSEDSSEIETRRAPDLGLKLRQPPTPYSKYPP